ncbi:DNA-binding protein [Salinarchaeum laminariae]|uniref:DNA-binding protein n=1 Tax=Salinarchaeum laminariae TaxID=869888 RepID=UPI0020C09045|nr:DNA-binding protein [Salinarchaeum laminariae]
MSNEEDIEDLREQKLQELQDRADDGDQAEAQQARQESAEAQKKAMLRQHLTDGARKRLNTVKMSKPEFGEQVEQQVLALARSGRVQGRIDEDQMKELLSELKPDSKSFDVKRR